MNERYETLKTQRQANIEQLQTSLACRKRIETSVTRLNSWASEACQYCSNELQLDAPLEQLQRQLTSHEQLLAAANDRKVELQQLRSDCEQITASLSPDDVVTCNATTTTLTQLINRHVIELISLHWWSSDLEKSVLCSLRINVLSCLSQKSFKHPCVFRWSVITVTRCHDA